MNVGHSGIRTDEYSVCFSSVHFNCTAGEHTFSHHNKAAFKTRQAFQPDYASDIPALYGLNSESGGGQSAIASSWTMYNPLAQTGPDLLGVLAQNNWTITPQVLRPSPNPRRQDNFMLTI